MNKKDVFAIEGFLPVKEDAWMVKGRAYENLKVGDIVAVDNSNQFTITAILTYGKAVRQLNQMLTGDLILQGVHGERLKEAGMLVKPWDSVDL